MFICFVGFVWFLCFQSSRNSPSNMRDPRRSTVSRESTTLLRTLSLERELPQSVMPLRSVPASPPAPFSSFSQDDSRVDVSSPWNSWLPDWFLLTVSDDYCPHAPCYKRFRAIVLPCLMRDKSIDLVPMIITDTARLLCWTLLTQASWIENFPNPG